jgi:hypothetical protein
MYLSNMNKLLCASLILISSSLFITSCSKELDAVPTSENFLVEKDDHLVPNGQTPPPEQSRSTKPKRYTQPTPTSTPTTSGSVIACLYFDFDGETVNNNAWNNGASFYCQPSVMTAEAKALAMSRVELAYASYNVTVTDDVNVYNNSAVRQRIIVTPSSNWYTNSSTSTGVARIGSLFQSAEVPSFVFTDRLSENTKYIGDIMMHESGHTIGLRHQSSYDQSCLLVNNYRMGTIMGYPFDLPQAAWIYGTTTSCNTYQDDNNFLSQMLGLR